LKLEKDNRFIQVSAVGFTIEHTKNNTLRIYYEQEEIYLNKEGEILDFAFVEKLDDVD